MRVAVFTVKRLVRSGSHFYTYGGFGAGLRAQAALVQQVVLLAHVRVGEPPAGYYRLDVPNMVVVPLPWYNSELGALLSLPWMFVVAMREVRNADAVHARMPDYTGVVGAFAARILRRPLVCQIVGDWQTLARQVPLSRRGGLGAFLRLHLMLYDVLERFVCARQRVLAQGRSCFEKHRTTARATLVVSAAHSRADLISRRERVASADRFALLTVARLNSEKNHAATLRILARLREMGVPATLDLVGDGPKRKELESLARELGIGPYVRFHGMVEPGPRLWECFDRADVFVLSSTSEGTPKVILEAMARGVPVFASAVGGVPDVVEDGRTGFLFDCLDLEQAVGRLAQLAKSPEALARVADEARIVAERQTVEAQAEITVRALADEMRRR